MKNSVIIILVAFAFLLTAMIILRQCTGFVSFFDGERDSKMIPIGQGYYYNRTDSKIWTWEKPTNSYKKILEIELDSLCWSERYILGYGNNHYVILNTNDNSVLTTRNKDTLLLVLKHANYSCNSLEEIPPISFTTKK